MATSIIDGPFWVYGSCGNMTAATFGYSEPDPNPGAGPNVAYQGEGVIDPRYFFRKDQLVGSTGLQPAHFSMPRLRSVGQIPAAVSTSNIAAAANVTNGTAMTLASANVTGITVGVPIIPFSAGGVANGTPVNVIAIDFGFAFCTCTSGNVQVTVADSNMFQVGMPLVIAGGVSATACLLTTVASIVDTTHITLQNAPTASPNPAAIGMGNIWGTNTTGYLLGGVQAPTAALPFMAGGPGLFLDGRQTIARVISITGATGGAGGTFLVKGYDIYGVPMSNLITVGAGAVTGWGTKAFKYIASVTPQFTDAHNYSVGTSDMFGLSYRANVWDDCFNTSWASALMTASTGFTGGLALITTSTTTTADVRGLIQTSTANGSGTGIGTTASNGTVSSLAMSGNRLTINQDASTAMMLLSSPAYNATLVGNLQV